MRRIRGDARRVVRIRRSLQKAWTELQQIGKRRPPAALDAAQTVLREGPRDANAPGLAVGVVDRSAVRAGDLDPARLANRIRSSSDAR